MAYGEFTTELSFSTPRMSVRHSECGPYEGSEGVKEVTLDEPKQERARILGG